MRLRNIPGSRDEIARNPMVVHEPSLYKGNWKEIFGNDHPLYIEVGMGKGRFLMDLAIRHPENNYVGIEMYSSVLLRGLQKAEQLPEEQRANFRFIRMDARELADVFAPNEISGIYLNFSDPWPKDRHAKRRLTSRQFLSRYEQILKPGGLVEFKTDNQDLFTFSLEEVQAQNWELLYETRDLHHSPELMQENIMTEYEERFSSMGNPICKLCTRPSLQKNIQKNTGRTGM